MRLHEIIKITIERTPEAMSVKVISEGTLRILADPVWVTSTFPEFVIRVTPDHVEFQQRSMIE